jgi:hypothetical protein
VRLAADGDALALFELDELVGQDADSLVLVSLGFPHQQPVHQLLYLLLLEGLALVLVRAVRGLGVFDQESIVWQAQHALVLSYFGVTRVQQVLALLPVYQHIFCRIFQSLLVGLVYFVYSASANLRHLRLIYSLLVIASSRTSILFSTTFPNL